MQFKDIPGRQEITDRLISSVTEQRVSHAQIFAGSEGTGKLAMAIAYAQYINCQQRTETDSCGVCPSCTKISRLIHPDLHFVFPIVRAGRPSDPVSNDYMKEWREFYLRNPFFSLNDWLRALDVENAQAIIYAAESAEIIRKLSLKTYEAEYKVMIIWLPERMHQTAANKLLKLIEEPIGKTLFILVSEEPEHIIPTILSRCQMLKFRGIASDAIVSYLMSKYDVEKARAEEIAHVARGNMVRAIAMTGEAAVDGDNLGRFRQLMRVAWMRDLGGLKEWSEEIATTGREAQKNFLSYSLSLVRANFVMNSNNGDPQLSYMTNNETEFSEKFYPYVNSRNIEKLYKELNKAHYHIEANGNAKIVFLDMALKVTKVIKA